MIRYGVYIPRYVEGIETHVMQRVCLECKKKYEKK